MIVVAFFVHALAGLSATPVVFTALPAFFERYAAELEYSEPSSSLNELETDNSHLEKSESEKLTADFSNKEVLD